VGLAPQLNSAQPAGFVHGFLIVFNFGNTISLTRYFLLKLTASHQAKNKIWYKMLDSFMQLVGQWTIGAEQVKYFLLYTGESLPIPDSDDDSADADDPEFPEDGEEPWIKVSDLQHKA